MAHADIPSTQDTGNTLYSRSDETVATDPEWPSWPMPQDRTFTPEEDRSMDWDKLLASKVGRRTLLAAGLGLPVVAAAGLGARELRRSSAVEQLPPAFTFHTKESQEIADALGLTTTALVEPGYELPGDFTAFQSEQLFPIFHPKVYEQKDLLYRLAQEKDIPVNFLAFIASIESGGNPEAGSGKGAVGLFQLMPQFFLEGVVDESMWHDPEVTGEIAAEYIRQCLSGARDFSTERGEDLKYRHPNLFIRAAGMYNAGVSGASHEYSDLPPETQQYMQHARRFMQVAEIANGLRGRGYSDEEIVKALRSRSVDVRAGAFQQRSHEYNANEALEYLSGNPVKEPANDMEKDLYEQYEACLKGNNSFPEQPLNPFLAIHTATAGGFVALPENKDAKNYFAINTARDE